MNKQAIWYAAKRWLVIVPFVLLLVGTLHYYGVDETAGYKESLNYIDWAVWVLVVWLICKDDYYGYIRKHGGATIDAKTAFEMILEGELRINDLDEETFAQLREVLDKALQQGGGKIVVERRQ